MASNAFTTQAAPASAPEPTREQLQLAYRQLAHPARWPRTLDQALAHPTLGICLRALARQMGRAAWRATPAAPSLPRGPVPPTPTQPPQRQHSRAPGTGRIDETWPPRRTPGVDRKRAAANDRDD